MPRDIERYETELSDSMPSMPFRCGDAPECHDEDNPCKCNREEQDNG